VELQRSRGTQLTLATLAKQASQAIMQSLGAPAESAVAGGREAGSGAALAAVPGRGGRKKRVIQEASEDEEEEENDGEETDEEERDVDSGPGSSARQEVVKITRTCAHTYTHAYTHSHTYTSTCARAWLLALQDTFTLSGRPQL
jgi:hypothetical protein